MSDSEQNHQVPFLRNLVNEIIEELEPIKQKSKVSTLDLMILAGELKIIQSKIRKLNKDEKIKNKKN